MQTIKNIVSISKINWRGDEKNMPLEENIEELVDRLLTSLETDEEIKKRKPKPFRYVTDKKEIQELLSESETTTQQDTTTVMRTTGKHKIVDEHLAVVGIGDVETIENIIRKHQVSRKIQ